MKILLSFALILIIGSISAQDLILGTWNNPYTSGDTYGRYCCVPTSIQIYCTGNSSCTANYKYPGEVGTKCWKLFMSTSGSDSAFSNVRFIFQASNYTGTPELTVYANSGDPNDVCKFTMQSRTPPASGGIVGIILFIIVFFIIVASASAKQYQKRQALIITQNLTHQQPIATVPGFNFNTAPTAVQVHQPQIVHQQIAYTAPNQFPNTQVNMNYGGGNNGGFHVQGHY